MTTPGAVPLPWGRRQFALLVALNALGAVLILVAWFWASGSGEPETAPLNLAVVAMMVAGGTNAGWLMRGRRAIGAPRRAWLVDLTGRSVESGRPVRRAPAVVTPTAEPAPVKADDVVLVVRAEGSLRFHRPGCLLIADRPVDAVARSAASAAGRIPCGACGA